MNRNDLPAPNMTCEVCGRKYRRCKKCAELHGHGIEAWREHCDSIECYQTLIFSQIDPAEATQEEYDRVVALELPEDRKPVDEIQAKLDEIGKQIKARATAYTTTTAKSNVTIASNKNTYNNGKKNYPQHKRH